MNNIIDLFDFETVQYLSNSPYPIAFLDLNRFGNAKASVQSIPFELLGKINAGDYVWVTEDGEPPFLCRITNIVNDVAARFETVTDKHGTRIIYRNEIEYHA